MRAVEIDVFLWRAGDVNPLIDRVDTAKIRGLTSPARPTQPQSNPREVYPADSNSFSISFTGTACGRCEFTVMFSE